MLRLLATVGLVLGLTGCTGLSQDINALSADKNAVCLTLTTPWGTEQYSRNGGCGVVASMPITTSVTTK